MSEIRSNTIQAHIACYNKELEVYEYLLLQRADNLDLYPTMWQVVTGWIEDGETAVEAAKREITEETGLEILKMWTVPYITSFYNPPMDQIHFSSVFGVLVRNKEKLQLSFEHQDYKWLKYGECISFLELPSHQEATRIFSKFVLAGEMKDFLLIEDASE